MKKVLALLFMGPLSLLLLEVAARWLHHPPPLRRVYDPFAYRIPHPHLVDRFTNWEGEEVTVVLNELGMRGPSLSQDPQAAPATVTLVFLGGSTTENYAWNRPDTFPELVAAKLRDRLEGTVQVLNAGMSSATTSTSLGRFQHQIVDLRPSLVVVLHAINDLVAGFHTGFRGDGRHLVRPPGTDWTPRSYLLSWLRSRRSGPSSPAARRPTPRQEELHYTDYDTFPARQVYRRNLRSMAAMAQAHAIPVLFLTQASMYREEPQESDWERFFMVESLIARQMVPPDIPSLAAGMKAFNQDVLDLPQSDGVYVFDLAARLARDWDNFYDECHLTKRGNLRVAEELTPVVAAILETEDRAKHW